MHEQEAPDLWVGSTQLKQAVAEMQFLQGDTQAVQVPNSS
jgi:hypothetical protein